MENKDFSQILGIGDICITTNTRVKMLLKDMRYISKLCLILLSADKLDEDRYTSNFSKGYWKFIKRLLIVAKGKKCCNVYVCACMRVPIENFNH